MNLDEIQVDASEGMALKTRARIELEREVANAYSAGFYDCKRQVLSMIDEELADDS